MATLSRGQTFGATETITNTKLHALVDSGSISGILNADCDNAMALANSKLANIIDSGKVGGTSLFGLASIPSGAGAIPSEQLQTNSLVLANVSQSAQGFKHFATIPGLPSSDPDDDNEASRKKYVDDKVVVGVGTAAHGATISFPTLPSGRVSGDYTWYLQVSVNAIGTYSGGDGDNLQQINCSVNQSTRVVTCTARQRDGDTVNGTANYKIMGVLN